MKLKNEYLEKEKLDKMLDFVLLSIRSKADNSIKHLILEISNDNDKVELKELTLSTDSGYISSAFKKIYICITRKNEGFFRTKYKYKIDITLRSNTETIDISDSTNNDKILKIYDFLVDVDYQQRKKSTDDCIDKIIEDLDKTISLAYKRDGKIDSLLDGK